MSVAINCSSCGKAAKIPTSLFAERFRGRKTNIRCKACATTIVVDDTGASSLLDGPLAAGSSGSLGAVEVSLPPEPEIFSLPVPLSEITPEPTLVEQHARLAGPRRSRRVALPFAVLGLGVLMGVIAASRNSSTASHVASQPVKAAERIVVPLPSVIESTPQVAEPAAPAAPSVAARALYDEGGLGFAMRWALRQADLCHKQGGGPPGTVRVELAFEPTGKVSRVSLDGVSAPDSAEARCIVAQFRSVMIPPFSGGPFTTRRELKLR